MKYIHNAAYYLASGGLTKDLGVSIVKAYVPDEPTEVMDLEYERLAEIVITFETRKEKRKDLLGILGAKEDVPVSTMKDVEKKLNQVFGFRPVASNEVFLEYECQEEGGIHMVRITTESFYSQHVPEGSL